MTREFGEHQARGEDNVLRLRDGRSLSYAEYGNAAGTPLMFFHGMPGSRYGAALLDEQAKQASVRVISPDRPGFGRSDFQAGRTLLRWPNDAIELADALGVSRFGVVGVSSGGAYVAACALKIPDRLISAHIVSGAGPMDAPGATDGMMRMNKMMWTLSRRAPFVASTLWRLVARAAQRNPDRAAKPAKSSMPPSDQRVFERPEVQAAFVREFQEAFRGGSRGAAHDARLSARPWGFRLEEIRMRVHLWQGEEDRNVPPSMGRYQAQAISNCVARFFPGEGHAGWIDRIDELLAIVNDAASTQRA